MDKDTSEIVKLTERISKDPKSKLFVPLAEEYKKVGDVEMAIHVLSEGLKNNPTYVTARSLLGRLLYENGDIIAAQKEFEEVVKAIPDNLLAQRKLGDLYSLQNNHAEALKHYQIALSLNPADKTIGAIVTKLREVIKTKPKLQDQGESIPPISEPVVLPDQPAEPARPSVAVSLPQTDLAPSVEQPSVQEKSPSPQQSTSIFPVAMADKEEETVVNDLALSENPEEPGFFAEAEQTPVSSDVRAETEEPEEVLVVEPLEDETPAMTAENSEGLLGEGLQQLAPVAESVSSTISYPDLQAPDKEPDLPGVQEPAASVAPEVHAPSLASTTLAQGEGKDAGKPVVAESDEFTTDTLAELYIVQGFYEKAIDIYQRMLADRPDSLGLREKLDRVRAMAMQKLPDEYATAVIESIEALEEKNETKTGEETKEHTIPFESAKTVDEISENVLGINEQPGQRFTVIQDEKKHILDAETEAGREEGKNEAAIGAQTDSSNMPDASREYKPSESSNELPPNETKVPSSDVFASAVDGSRSGKQAVFGDFEPKEYMPPDQFSRSTREEKVPVAPRQSLAARLETIDRLENWLKNIKKEK